MHSTDTIEDGYVGSGTHLTRSIKKHGLHNHVREIIEVLPNREELIKREIEIVNEELLRDPLCMNMVLGGKGGAQSGEKNSFYGKHHKPDTIEQIRVSMQGERGPCFGRVGALHPMYGTHHSTAASEKMSAAHLGKPLSNDHRRSIKQGHDCRNHDKHERNATIVKMVDEGMSRRDVALMLGVHINIVYGAIHRRNKMINI